MGEVPLYADSILPESLPDGSLHDLSGYKPRLTTAWMPSSATVYLVAPFW